VGRSWTFFLTLRHISIFFLNWVILLLRNPYVKFSLVCSGML
jgi:hypothetical protein